MKRVWSAVETVLRRHPWAVTLTTLLPCAYFSAAAVNHVLAAAVLKADITALTRPAAGGTFESSAESRAGTASYRSRDVDNVLRRNVFDADAGCLNCPPPVVEAEDAGAGAEDNRPPEPCDGQAKVTGAVQVDDPLWSFVFIAPAAGQPAMPFRLGQQADGKTVAAIGWSQDYGAYAILRAGSGPRCFYAQIMPPRQAPPPPTQPERGGAETGPAGGDSLSQVLEQGITRESPNSFSVRRSTIDRILENQAALMATTRIMPHSEGGRVTGVTLFGVRPGTLLNRLGLNQGDILTRINGLEIASPDRALEAYSRLRTADHITLSVTRNGAPTNIDFNIRP